MTFPLIPNASNPTRPSNNVIEHYTSSGSLRLTLAMKFWY
jgi:hypothetical protein